MRNWIFQGNPLSFDVDGYLKASTCVAWTIRQTRYKDLIEVGDRVFFWRSKGGAKRPYGVVAVGKIVSTPTVMPDHPESLPFWRAKPEENAALRCWVDVADCAISRGKVLPVDIISSDNLLQGLRILRLRQNTNYLIQDKEADRLFELYHEVTQHQHHVSAFSWTISDGKHAAKVLDKSAFLHRGTGIPKEVRVFFLGRELGPGERVDVTLSVDGESYPAHIAMESQGTARTRMFWDSDFISLLHKSFPHHLQLYQQDQEPSNRVVMRFERLEGYKSYKVRFGAELPESDIAQDIEAERMEEVGPRVEGGVREYYGKRYERDLVNRQKAIEYHGLTCKACGFNFEEVYGERGTGYIEVHHLRPISSFDKEQHVDPKTDLTTLCSNCHRMIHRKSGDVFTIQQLKAITTTRKGL